MILSLTSLAAATEVPLYILEESRLVFLLWSRERVIEATWNSFRRLRSWWAVQCWSMLPQTDWGRSKCFLFPDVWGIATVSWELPILHSIYTGKMYIQGNAKSILILLNALTGGFIKDNTQLHQLVLFSPSSFFFRLSCHCSLFYGHLYKIGLFHKRTDS